MIVKTSELEGAALDWAVAKAVGKSVIITSGRVKHTENGLELKSYVPSLFWSHGGPLIERYWIDFYGMVGEVEACVQEGVFFSKGETHLVAAMRSIVEHVLGSEVDVPEELV